jgi:2-methylcitrate dehydratase PrpD
MTLLTSLAGWAAKVDLAWFTPEGVRAGVRGLLDTGAAAVAGGGMSIAAQAAAACSPQSGSVPEVVTWSRRNSVDAAFLNGVATHLLDYDDSAIGELIGHPSAVVWPAVWSAWYEGGAKDPNDLLLGYLVGVEAMMRFAAAMGGGGGAYRRGFHSTTLFGVVAAALAAARVLRLDEAGHVGAGGLAACFASGLRASFGKPGKAIQVGHAARSAVSAALLARQGLHAGETMLDDPHHGMWSAFWSSGTGPNTALAEVKEPLIVTSGVRLKPFAACRGTHRSIDAALNLRRRLEGRTDQIAEIVCDPAPEHRNILLEHDPRTGLAAKFSLEHAVTMALLDGGGGLAQFTDARATADDVIALRRRVRIVPTDDPETWHEPFRVDRVSVVLRDGTTLAEECEVEPGHRLRPLSEEGLARKVAECLEYRFGADAMPAPARMLASRVASGPIDPAMVGTLADCLAAGA